MEIKLKAQKREKGEKLSKDLLPAIVYGMNFDNISIKINLNEFIKLYEKAGESNLIELDIEGEKGVRALVKDVQRDPIKNTFSHIDFYKVDMDKEISAEIPLEFIGESKAVKETGALLVKNINEVSVECMPKDLVDHIDIDISVLAEVGDIIKISDITVPQGMKILNNPDDSVATIIEPQKEEVVEAVVPEATEAKKPEEVKDNKGAEVVKE